MKELLRTSESIRGCRIMLSDVYVLPRSGSSCCATSLLSLLLVS